MINLKEKLLKALCDFNIWERRNYSYDGYAWDEYICYLQKNMTFLINKQEKYACVFINDYCIEIEFLPFGKIYRAINKLDKHLKNKENGYNI